MKIGQVCMKTAGRDAGQLCVIIKELDQTRAFIDGNTRRRTCSLKHLEPLNKILSITEDASHVDVLQAMRAAGFPVLEKKQRTKERTKKQKPKRQHTTKKKTAPAALKTQKTKASKPTEEKKTP